MVCVCVCVHIPEIKGQCAVHNTPSLWMGLFQASGNLKRKFRLIHTHTHMHTRTHPRICPAVPRPCLITKDLDCVVPIWITLWDRIRFTRAEPFPCRVPATLRPWYSTVPWTALKASSQGHSTAGAQYYTCKLKYSDLKEDINFGFFRLPSRLSRRLLPECLSIMNWPAGGVYQTKLRLSWMKRRWLFWLTSLSAGTVYSTRILTTIC